MAEKLKLYIDGTWVDPVAGGTLEARNPATGEVLATFAAATLPDVDRAVQAARRAFDDGPWGVASEPRERAALLFEVARLVRRERERLARIEVADAGKQIDNALEEVDEAAFMFEYYAGWATKLSGSVPSSGPDSMSIIVKEPVGVAGLITPWNYPILMASQKIAPALAAGCTAILKPATETPLTSLELGKLFDEAGAPPGVFNVPPRRSSCSTNWRHSSAAPERGSTKWTARSPCCPSWT